MTSRTAARLAWGLCSLAIIGIVTVIPLKIVNGDAFTLNDVTQLLAFASIAAVGAVVASHQPGNPLGWIYCGLAVAAILLGGITSEYARYGLVTHPGSLPFARVAEWLTNWGWVPPLGVLMTFAFLLFPDGHLPSRRWRPVAWVAAAAISAMTVSFALQTVDYTDTLNRHVPNPYSTPGVAAFFDVAREVSALVFIACAILSVASMFVRYRRGGRDERQQLKWLMFAAVVLVLFISLPFEHGNETWTDGLLGVLLAFVPIACGIAILKYRLYDIDVVINRAVVFGALAAFITAVYVGIVVGIGALLGQGDRANAGLQIAATAVVALAFQPVRRAVQGFANRLVYGRRATPYDVMADFSRRMSGTLEVEQALPQMAEVAARGVGATSGRVRLFLPRGDERVVTWPEDAPGSEPTRAIEVRHQGEPIGEIAVSMAPGDALLPAEEGLLRDLASQAGLALHNVRLTDELEARLEELAIQADQLKTSRQRLVTARDAQRRGLERDIREGPRRQLTAIADGVARASDLAVHDADAAVSELDRLGERANDTLEGLRDLARGIFPPLLADKGIVPALDAHIRKVGVRATVEASPGLAGLRFDDQTEACVYFCCLQALQNVLRHAGNAATIVRLSAGPKVLTFEVVDRGPGFDPAATDRGMGLQIMQDRVDALEGELLVTSAPGAGTTVTGRIPARAVEAVTA
jgi:signal transduction histidine kinase